MLMRVDYVADAFDAMLPALMPIRRYIARFLLMPHFIFDADVSFSFVPRDSC